MLHLVYSGSKKKGILIFHKQMNIYRCIGMLEILYRLFDKKRLNPQLSHPLSDPNEQKNQRYGFSWATKQPQNIFLLAPPSVANDSQLSLP
jgi:hypothetical protein